MALKCAPSVVSGIPLSMSLIWTCVCLLTAPIAVNAVDTKPNIVFILADDLGWGDVGWNNHFMPTPNLDRMAREGMILNQSYVQQTCSPSRAALMSGRYPYHLGLQEETINSHRRNFLTDEQPILPEVLKSLGYATHMVGKWHLGFCNWRYTPTYRGFDSFYGYYSASEDYYTHMKGHGFDFRDDDLVDHTGDGHYSTQLYTDRAVEIINDHNSSQPLFLYFSLQAVHTPLQVPHLYKDQFCGHIHDNDRKTKCGMIAAMDEAVHTVVQTLKSRGLFDNTFIIFSSDNGGPVHSASSNWPLRGSKITIWEGGTRGAAFVHAPALLQRSNVSYEELIHIVDWYPTLVEAAGGSTSIDNIDGVSQWQNLLTGGHGPRTEFIYNINEVRNFSALRQGRFKLIQGFPRKPAGWYAPPELVDAHTIDHNQGQAHSPPYQLYNLHRDPEEKHNIIDSHQDVFQQMKARLDEYRQTLVPTRDTPHTTDSNPSNFDGNWSPGWC